MSILPQSVYTLNVTSSVIQTLPLPTGKPPKRDGQSVATVYARLRTAILKGQIEPGASIPLLVLAANVGAGRTPLREALRMLQGEGLVISEPNRKVKIADLSAEDAEQLFVMRLALEVVAIRVTVPSMTSTDIAELEGYLAQMEHYLKRRDLLGFSGPHHAFHQRLVAGSGSRVRDEIARLTDHSERYRFRFAGSGSWAEGPSKHRAILSAAARGHSDQAASRLASHYDQTARLVLRGLDPDWDLSRLHTVVEAVAPDARSAPKVS